MFSIKRIITLITTAVFVLISAVTITYALRPNNLHDYVLVNSVAPITSTLTSNRYTQMDDLSVVNDNPFTSLEDHELLGVETTNNLALYVHPVFLSLRVVNQNTGYIWASNMNYDYREPGHPEYDVNNYGSENYLNPEYDINKDSNVRQDRSPVTITYYNTLMNNNIRFTEYLFEPTTTGLIVKNNLNDKVGFKAKITMPKSKIRFQMSVYLDETGLNIEVPADTIEDNNNFIISTLTLYRYFGFTKKDYTPGYVFIPDGVGALMRYNSHNESPFIKNFYGPDYTLQGPSLEESLTASLYGNVHGINQNAVMTVLNKGAGNATLTYVPASGPMIFNRIYTTFEYRTTYTQRLNASGTSTVERIQTEKNPFDIHLVYIFLENEDANYVGMANRYREYLKEQNIKFEKLDDENDIPLHLDILATENKSVWYGRDVFSMTTTKQLLNIIDDLQNNGINKMDITIHGWQKGGMSYTTPNFGSHEGKFGDLWDLYDKANVNFFYGVTPFRASSNAGGYKSNDIAQNQGSELTKLKGDYLLKIEEALNLSRNNYSKANRNGVINLALIDVANQLYSDYSKNVKSRSKYIETIKEFLTISELNLVNKPFDYLFGADVITDLNLYSSQQIKFTDTVPFLPIVLSGYKNVYGRSSNFFANTSNELLRMVDYHVFPSFYLTHESAQKLIKTGSNYIFTSRYNDWQEEIIRQYDYVNNALSSVYNEQIVKRDILSPGVVKNTYSNGTRIYINYTGVNETFDGITIEALSYEVIT